MKNTLVILSLMLALTLTQGCVITHFVLDLGIAEVENTTELHWKGLPKVPEGIKKYWSSDTNNVDSVLNEDSLNGEEGEGHTDDEGS